MMQGKEDESFQNRRVNNDEAATNANPTIECAVASTTDLFWIEFNKAQAFESIKTLNESTKQINTITPMLSGLYTFGLSIIKFDFTKIQSHGYMYFTILLPLALWTLSLVASIKSGFPKLYTISLDKPNDIRVFFEKRMKSKYRWLFIAYFFLVLSILSLTFNLWYIALPPSIPWR